MATNESDICVGIDAVKQGGADYPLRLSQFDRLAASPGPGKDLMGSGARIENLSRPSGVDLGPPHQSAACAQAAYRVDGQRDALAVGGIDVCRG